MKTHKTFRTVKTEHLEMLYTGENWVLENKTESEQRKILIDCAKHNGYTPDFVSEQGQIMIDNSSKY